MGSQDFQVSLPEASPGKNWHKSPSLSSATTTDEDFSFCGSPKQRWADLSEEDDDMFTAERSPFGFLALEDETEERQGGTVQHDEIPKTPYGGDQLHQKSGSLPKLFKTEFARSGAPSDTDERKQSGPPSVPPFRLLPPSIDSRSCCTGASPVLGIPSAPQTQLTQHALPPGAATKAAASEIFTVSLSGIPAKLCNEVCLDAILWAAGVQRSALGYNTKKNGHITISFGTLDAATHCISHFKACSWTTGKLQVDLVTPAAGRRSADGHGRYKQGAAPGGHRHGKQTKNGFAVQQAW